MLFALITYAHLREIALAEYDRVLARSGAHWLTDRDDAIQEAMLRCCRAYARYDPKGGEVGSFLRIVIRRCYTDLLRARLSRKLSEPAGTPLENVDVSEDRRHVPSVLTRNEIAAGRGEWIYSRIDEGWSPAAVASTLGVSRSYVHRYVKNRP